MIFKSILFIFFITITKNSVNSVPSLQSNNAKLLVILVDGFRWDYVERDKSLKGFPLIAQNGVHAEHVKPIFPANSYPNWYAISTGLFAESNGIIGNFMFDRQRKEMFWMGGDKNASHIYWWDQTEPLWTNAEKQGVKTSMYLWDGCQVNISGIEVSLCHRLRAIYDPKEADNQTRTYLNTILDDFSDNKYRLSMLYYELVDHFGHEFGPSSENVTKAVQQIDSILFDLFHQINDRKLNESVNVVIVSDHGMTDLKDFKKILWKDMNVNFDNIELLMGWGSQSEIIPKPGKEDEVITQLSKVKGIKVYKKSDIPQQFHFKNNDRVLPILVTTDLGYYLEMPKIFDGRVRPITFPDPDNAPLTGGYHGYNNELSLMQGIMYGFGPAFKKNFSGGPIEMVDHYNVFCKILGITPHPNNGTLARVQHFFK